MIVIIRDIEAATNNADSLIAFGIDAIPLAVLSHMPIELEPNVLNVSYQAIIFTSKYGILNYDSFSTFRPGVLGIKQQKSLKILDILMLFHLQVVLSV